jgi:hypothetical protein
MLLARATNEEVAGQTNVEVAGQKNVEVAGQTTNVEVAGQTNEEVAGQTNEEMNEEVAGKMNDEVAGKMNDEVAGKMNGEVAGEMNKCTFVIHACDQKKRNNQAVIIKLDLDHSCGCMLRPGTKVSVGTSFVTAQARGLIKDVPNAAPPVNLQAHVRRCHSAHANYMTAHRAKKRVEEAQMSDEVRSFQLIQPYFSKLQITMPGTVALMTRDEEECRLLRTFVMLKPLVRAFRSCLPVLSLDVCHMTNSFKGVLMCATMMDDGDRHTQLLAWGTAPIENYEHWNWFACQLKTGSRKRL